MNELAAFADDGLAPEPALPGQFFDLWYRTRAIAPERALILAMLLQAVEDVRKHRGARRVRERRIYADTCKWIASEDRRWPFSFVNICEVLNLPADRMRAGLLGSGELARFADEPERMAV